MSSLPSTLHVQTERFDDVHVIRPSGVIDYWSVAPLREELEQQLATDTPRIVLDLYEVPFCDSSGLGLLLSAQLRAAAAGGWLRIARPHLQMRRVLAITRLDGRMHSYASVQDALDDARERERQA